MYGPGASEIDLLHVRCKIYTQGYKSALRGSGLSHLLKAVDIDCGHENALALNQGFWDPEIISVIDSNTSLPLKTVNADIDDISKTVTRYETDEYLLGKNPNLAISGEIQ